ncbi:MAG: pyruvate formate-lyase [Anaerolineae bacterium]|nr:MAG: pyruvate formate-lyase [Anaerolineae bacterium]
MKTPFDLELAFTETYQRYLRDDPALREAHCLWVLLPPLFDPPQPGDLFAGRMHYPAVGFSLELASGGPLYYCHAERILPHLDALHPEERARVQAMLDFWKREATIEGHLLSRLPEETRRATSNHVAEMGGRLAGTLLDFEKLVRLGIPGLRAELAKARRANGDLPLYRGMDLALDLFVEIIRMYAVQTGGEMRQVLENIAVRAPETFREAAQLAWLYALVSGTVNYGRMDVYLGDFYAADLDSGRLSEAEALALTQSLWRLIAARQTVFNGRVYLGGRERPNEANADRFALVAMEATRTVIEVEPQLTLRFYEGQNPALMEKALQVIGEGRTFPMLYNDDVNIPAVANAFRVPTVEAEHYLPYGCGEYALDHRSVGSPNCSLNLLKNLEVVLHNGRDMQTGEVIGFSFTPNPSNSPLPQGEGLGVRGESAFPTFDSLWSAYARQLEYYIEKLAERHRLEVDTEAEQAAFLFCSMLYDDCLARGKSLLGGGARYRGGLIETYGMVNAADSLTAIKRLVYDRKLLSLEELVAALDADFEGYERERRLMLACPKFGNDDPEADEMLCRVSDHVALATLRQAERVGLDYFLIVNINNYMNVTLGGQTIASAEGRRAGKPLANGNTPTAGNDTQGVTAMLNSLVKADPSVHAGYTQNMKFSKSLFREQLHKVQALLQTYFQNGGAQAMITVVGRGDLENALRDPASHRNLIVRVGGFSARFVELAPEIQQDLLMRTLY